MIATIVPDLPVLFVDTGYHFPETIAFRDQLVDMWNLAVVVLKNDAAFGAESMQNGQPLYLTNPDLCCEIRKVTPMRKAMHRYQAWISGIRRDQSNARAQADVIEVTTEGRTRIHPLLEWTQADVDRYMILHDLPKHPLMERGYTSIGCAPCTCPPLRGGDSRSGRWQGTGKTECGLHTHLRGVSKE
jgi:phosphoadenosine phosphosulfate reductase